MKRWKLSLLTLSLFTLISGIVFFASCEKDPCTDLKCKNGSACTEGFCRCPTGYEGAECETKTASRYIGSFAGSNHCNDLPSLIDTVDVRMVAEPNIVEFKLRHNNASEIIRGTVEANRLIIGDEQSGGYLRQVQAVLDHDMINIVINRSYGPGNNTICTFNGTRFF